MSHTSTHKTKLQDQTRTMWSHEVSYMTGKNTASIHFCPKNSNYTWRQSQAASAVQGSDYLTRFRAKNCNSHVAFQYCVVVVTVSGDFYWKKAPEWTALQWTFLQKSKKHNFHDVILCLHSYECSYNLLWLTGGHGGNTLMSASSYVTSRLVFLFSFVLIVKHHTTETNSWLI